MADPVAAVANAMEIVKKCFEELDDIGAKRRKGLGLTTMIMVPTILTHLMFRGIDEIRDELNQLEQQYAGRFLPEIVTCFLPLNKRKMSHFTF